MSKVDLDFLRYVERRRGAREAQAREGAAYAYGGDLKVLRTLERMRPVKLAVEATVRMWTSAARNELLGSAVRVSSQKHPQVQRLAERAAATLHVSPPAVYVSPQLAVLEAHTFGTDEEAYILLGAPVVEHLNEAELGFVLGHELAHIQNGHVLYETSLYYLQNFAGRFVKWIVTPATMALSAWARRAQITCDRAGLVVSRSLDVAQSALSKLALGSTELYQTLDVDGFLALDPEAAGAAAERFKEHPLLPRRIAALRAFAASAYYHGLSDEEGGATLAECDARVAEILGQ
jgi:Zn-dependent protease with chaperone function